MSYLVPEDSEETPQYLPHLFLQGLVGVQPNHNATLCLQIHCALFMSILPILNLAIFALLTSLVRSSLRGLLILADLKIGDPSPKLPR